MTRLRATIIAVLGGILGAVVLLAGQMVQREVQRRMLAAHGPVASEFELERGAHTELRERWPGAEIHAWDTRYWGCSLGDWQGIIAATLEDMPLYLPERFDCDNMARLFAALVALRYGLNTCAVAIGTAPGGYHAWCIVRAEDGWHNLEPQTGTLDPAGYVPDLIICA